MDRNATLLEFLNQCCTRAEDASTSEAALLRAQDSWRDRSRLPIIRHSTVLLRLARCGFTRYAQGGAKYWRGIELRTDIITRQPHEFFDSQTVPGGEVGANELLRAFKRWSTSSRVTRTQLNEMLNERGHMRRVLHGHVLWCGLSLKEQL